MDKQLKQRLLGAAVLVALAVIIVPELVKEPMNQTKLASVDMPPRPAIASAKPAMTLALPPAEQTTALAQDPTQTTQAQNPQSTEEVVIDSDGVIQSAMLDSGISIPSSDGDGAAAPAPELPATPNSLTTTSPAPTTTPTVVKRQPPAQSQPERQPSVAATRQEAPRRTTTSTAKASQQPVDKVNLPKIELISQKQYRSTSSRVAQSGGNTAPAAGASYPSPSGQGWIVQAGSFAVASNASQMRDQLRSRQFPASLSPVTVDGRTLYRVNIGPYRSRSAGEQARQRLWQEARVNGSVRRDYN